MVSKRSDVYNEAMSKQPSTNGDNGERDASGRFATGNTGGPGNPYARKVAKLRSLILEAVTEEDLRTIVATLVKRAREGDLLATREILNRLVGKPANAFDSERLQLEKQRVKLAEERTAQADERLWPKL